MRRPIRVAEITLAFPCAARATGGQGTIGPLRRFFGDFSVTPKKYEPTAMDFWLVERIQRAQASRTSAGGKKVTLRSKGHGFLIRRPSRAAAVRGGCGVSLPPSRLRRAPLPTVAPAGWRALTRPPTGALLLTVVPAAFSASSLRQKRGTSSNPPRCICRRQRFGGFLESASLYLPLAALRRFPHQREA